MSRGRSITLALLVIAGLTALYVVPRLAGIDAFVTTDEPLWLGRSANFYRALRSGELAYTYQMAHPGVLTMWAGTAAYWIEMPDWAANYPDNIQRVVLIDEVLRTLDVDPLRMMVSARISKILLQAVFFGISLIYTWRLFGLPALLAAGGMIAFDPFLSGLDTVLHVDGLFAIVSFAAVLAMAHAVRSGHTTMLPWLAAGALAACAWMQRSTGIVLVVLLILCLGVSLLHHAHRVPGQPWRSRFQVPAFSGLLWGGAALGTSVALLPALWVDPFGTMGSMWNWSSDAATGGHELPLFFDGEIVSGDPGMAFYPVTLLWRLTPVTLIGLVLFLLVMMVTIVSPVLRHWPPGDRIVAWTSPLGTKQTFGAIAILATFAVLYLLGMSVGAKKFDRYILPIYPILDLFAALGFVASAGIVARAGLSTRVVLPVVASVVLVTQAWSTVTVLPYRLDYYNPALGGSAAAEETLQMGWGQGAQEALDWIGRQFEPGDSVTVQGTGARSPYVYFLPEGATFAGFAIGTPAGWYETDFLIAGIQQWQRDISPAYRLVRDLDPVHVVYVQGVPYFNVYAPRMSRLPGALRKPTGCSHVQDQGLQLQQVIGRDGTVDLYWLTREAIVPHTAQVTVAFVPGADESAPVAGQERTAVWHPAAPGLVSKVTVPLPDGIASQALPGYWLDVVVTPVDAPAAVQPAGPLRTQSECFYQPPSA